MSFPVYADHVWHGPATVTENVQLARDTYRIRFACPEIARQVVPGQFLMLRLADCNDPLLGRPLALYDVSPDASGRPHFIDVVYLVVGKMTRLLPEFRPGSRLEVWGPLGNGFPPMPTEHLIMVAGGIGQTPFLSLAREYLGLHAYGTPPRHVAHARKVTLCHGVRNRDYLAGVDDFRHAGVAVQLATNDGSLGHHGLVTELIRPLVERSAWKCRLVCCGPEPMMAATAEIAAELELPCQLSLESPMACGIGICFSCVKKIRAAAGGWDYRRTCVEGPIFEAEDVQF
jgi:dihydroorotate dehydrogenase electron transfer subunit